MSAVRFGTAVILCGGRSSRMGFDKCGVLVGGIPLYEKIAMQLEQVFEEIILVTNKTRKIKHEKYKVVEDLVDQRGPLGGILTGLSCATSEYVFFVACDMPVVETAVINRFMEQLSGDAYMGAMGIRNGYLEPLYSFYSKGWIPKIEQALSDPHRSFSVGRLIQDEKIYLLPEEEWRSLSISVQGVDIYSNVNYVHDLELLNQVYGEKVTVKYSGGIEYGENNSTEYHKDHFSGS